MMLDLAQTLWVQMLEWALYNAVCPGLGFSPQFQYTTPLKI